MQGLKAAPARAGYPDAKSFCKAIGLDYITFIKAANGKINLIASNPAAGNRRAHCWRIHVL